MATQSKAEKDKRKPKFLVNLFKGRIAKAKEAATKKGMAESAMKSTIAKAEKKYAKESMFPKARDEQKTKTAKARPFKAAFDDATNKGKDRFLWKGKSYLTTKGKRAERFPVTTDKKSAATPKKSLREKITGFKTQKGFEDAKDKRRIEKRIANIKKRKNQGKSYSAKNLAELEAKLK